MKKGRFTVIIAAALVLTVVCGVLFAACNNDPPSVGSMGVEDFGNVFTDDLDTTAAENLAASAQQITASSAADSAGNVADGDTSTAWTAESTTGQYIEITFPSPTEINTVVLRENGNYISGFSFVTPDEKGEYPTDGYGYFENFFYRQQDRIERYRYCTFDAVEVTTFRIYFNYVDEGKELSISEVEIYNVAPKEYTQDFRVFNYYTAADLAAMTDVELSTELGRGVITDMILISMVFWEPDGTMIYAADPSTYTLLPDNSNYMDQYTEDPTYFNSLVDRVHSIAAPLGINVCLDLFPIKDEDGNFVHGLPGNMDTLMENITSLVAEDDRIDGIDFDWEYPNGVTEWKYYGDLIMRVSEAIDSTGKDKYISLALSADNVRLTQEQIDAVDFVQMMAYDRFDIKDGNHASFRSGAYSSMRYFVNIGFKPSQLVLGLPVYGRPNSWDTVWTNYGYKEIPGENGEHSGSEYEYDIEAWATYDKKPYTYWDNSQWLYYTGTNLDGSVTYTIQFIQVWVNGGAMVADKTAYVIEQGFAGMMLWREDTDCDWEAQDYDDNYLNLLRVIRDTAAERIVGYGE